MKRISFLLAALLMMGGMVMAQGPRRGGQDMDPKTRAERMTERMAKEYSLNEDQKQQLQDVNLTWVQKMAANQGGRSKDNKAANGAGPKKPGPFFIRRCRPCTAGLLRHEMENNGCKIMGNVV